MAMVKKVIDDIYLPWFWEWSHGFHKLFFSWCVNGIFWNPSLHEICVDRWWNLKIEKKSTKLATGHNYQLGNIVCGIKKILLLEYQSLLKTPIRNSQN
jgi:hypothetical protein